MSSDNEGNESRPPSRDFEIYLVLSLIFDTRFREYVTDSLPVEVFTEFDCQYIYETVLRLKKKKRPITFFAVYETIRRDMSLSQEKSNEVCKILSPYASVESDLSPIASMLDGVLPIVEDIIKKRVVELATVKSIDLFEQDKIDEVIDLWGKVGRQTIYQVSEKISVWDALHEAKGNIAGAIQYKLGVPTGIHGLDDGHHVEYLDQKLFFKGCGRGHLGIVLADSNIGKSTFMINIGLHQSLMGYNVYIYSLEMDKEYMVARSTSTLTGIKTDDVILGANSKRISKKVAEIEEKYPNKGLLDFHHYTRDTLTISLIAHDLTMAAKEGTPIDVVIIDYLDLMRADRQYREVRHEIGHNAVALRALGDEYGCAMFSPSQMNRGTFKDKKRPKDRSNISEDYSKVYTCDYLFNLTETVEEVKQSGKPLAQKELVRLFVDKNRFGRRGFTLTLHPDKDTGRFYDIFPQLP